MNEGRPGAVGEPAGDIYAPDEEGRQFRDGVFRPLDRDVLAEAPPDPARFPLPGHGPPFRRWDTVPRVPELRHLIGPSVIALAMGLGAGELLLWPNLITVNGYSIWWLFWVGVLTQFVVICEIERWTVVTGESVFEGMARLDRWGSWAWFFLAATLISFFWPGWASSSAEFVGVILAETSGLTVRWQPIALVMLALIWIALALSTIVYNALERFEIWLVLLFFPLLLVTLIVAGVRPEDALALAEGAVRVGRAPAALLTGEQFPTLLIAVAYAGSGGTLLLAQSLWLRDKGFGMAAYQGRIAGVRGRNESVSDSGFAFDARNAPTALARSLAWLRTAHRELLLTFVALILASVVITTLLVTSTLGTGNAAVAGDLTGMIEMEAEVLRRIGGLWLSVAFLLGGALVLFSTQLGIVDTVTRIAGSIFFERYGRHTRFWTLKRTFLFFLTLLVLASMAIIALSWIGGEHVSGLQPNFLVLIAGPFTIASMYLFALVVGYVNAHRLPPPLQPAAWRKWGMLWAGVLWGWFTAEQVSRVILGQTGAPETVVETLTVHPVRIVCYGAWLASLVWFAWATLRPRRTRA